MGGGKRFVLRAKALDESPRELLGLIYREHWIVNFLCHVYLFTISLKRDMDMC
jgi:hypothetical protein